MATKKTIEAVIAPPPPHMVGDGFRVHSFFPGGRLIDKKRMSPFFLLDYNSKVDFSPAVDPRGVGVHPHRGFETETNTDCTGGRFQSLRSIISIS